MSGPGAEGIFLTFEMKFGLLEKKIIHVLSEA